MNRSLSGILELLKALGGLGSLSEAQKIDRLFNAHPDFWFDPDAGRRLRLALTLEVKSLVNHDENMATNLADILIRDQARLPPREEDTDPVYREYDGRAGEILLLNDDRTEIRIIGPCPSSEFRWAAVERLSDGMRWLISWVVISELQAKKVCEVA